MIENIINKKFTASCYELILTVACLKNLAAKWRGYT